MSFMSTTHFFLPLRGAGRLAPHGAGDPFDCGRRARKSRWKSRAGAESTRLVVLVPKITVLRAWDTQGLFARSRGSVACSALTLTNAALAKPTATVALAMQPRHAPESLTLLPPPLF